MKIFSYDEFCNEGQSPQVTRDEIWNAVHSQSSSKTADEFLKEIPNKPFYTYQDYMPVIKQWVDEKRHNRKFLYDIEHALNGL